MIPVAFFALALGYEVYWDNEYETAVLLDRAAAEAELNEGFSLYNRFLYADSGAAQIEEGRNLSQTIEGTMSFTMLDSIYGDKTYDIAFRQEVLTGLTSANG